MLEAVSWASATLSLPLRVLTMRGTGRNGSEFLCAAAWATAWTTAAVRSRKSLVQVEMDNVDAHVAGSRHAHQRVHVRAVHVNQPARLMHDPANLLNVSFEEPERVRVRQHQAGNVPAGTELAQVIEIGQSLCRSSESS